VLFFVVKFLEPVIFVENKRSQIGAIFNDDPNVDFRKMTQNERLERISDRTFQERSHASVK
jgi:hypothetical protein